MNPQDKVLSPEVVSMKIEEVKDIEDSNVIKLPQLQNHRRILILGKAGSGKSSLAKSLFLNCQFIVSDQLEGVTKDVQVQLGQFRFSEKDSEKFYILDSQGLGDPNSQEDIAFNQILIEYLKKIEYFNLIIIVLRADEDRLDYINQELFEMLKQWTFNCKEKSYTQNFFDHITFVYTRFDQSKRKRKERNSKNQNDEFFVNKIIKILEKVGIQSDQESLKSKIFKIDNDITRIIDQIQIEGFDYDNQKLSLYNLYQEQFIEEEIDQYEADSFENTVKGINKLAESSQKFECQNLEEYESKIKKMAEMISTKNLKQILFFTSLFLGGLSLYFGIGWAAAIYKVALYSAEVGMVYGQLAIATGHTASVVALKNYFIKDPQIESSKSDQILIRIPKPPIKNSNINQDNHLKNQEESKQQIQQQIFQSNIPNQINQINQTSLNQRQFNAYQMAARAPVDGNRRQQSLLFQCLNNNNDNSHKAKENSA